MSRTGKESRLDKNQTVITDTIHWEQVTLSKYLDFEKTAGWPLKTKKMEGVKHSRGGGWG